MATGRRRRSPARGRRPATTPFAEKPRPAATGAGSRASPGQAREGVRRSPPDALRSRSALSPRGQEAIEQIEQPWLVRPLGDLPVAPRQVGESRVGSRADRQGADRPAERGNTGQARKLDKNRRSARREE